MKWGRKKPLASSFSSSTPHQSSSLISHVFPVSWLSKFKHKSYDNAERKPGKLNPQGKWHSSSVNSPKRVSERFVGNGKFYGFDDDGDAFWRLSFGQDNAEEKRKRVGFRSSHDSDGDDLLKVPVLSCPNCRKKETVKGSPRSCEIASEPRLKPRRELSNAEIRSPATSPEMRTIEEQREDLNSEQTRTEISDDEKRFSQRRSLYVSMEKRRKRTKQRNSFSKLRAETCKVKAIQDMKKLRKKKKKKNGAETGLDSFAVVKSSFDPRKDFKESIMEMILVKNMRQSDELEELLACYLTLNSDDHHDLIITVFKQVWFELDQIRFSD